MLRWYEVFPQVSHCLPASRFRLQVALRSRTMSEVMVMMMATAICPVLPHCGFVVGGERGGLQHSALVRAFAARRATGGNSKPDLCDLPATGRGIPALRRCVNAARRWMVAGEVAGLKTQAVGFAKMASRLLNEMVWVVAAMMLVGKGG
ncbi:hypothetical protein BD626DRAFT_478704 [Schizophyllum amplum]|uniref:Uncharacterized protein n=1 Tax=Schizophyllum amplum TaxID=97359 RepID=A0A550CRI4_9AGAR|nr:hypothetical protein BD626DRAFT_478704 [Auriculariopsis ampla]